MDDKTKNILGTLSPVYGLMSGQGAFGKLAPAAGLLPMALAKDRKEEEEEKEKARAASTRAATSGMKKGGTIKKMAYGGGIEQRGKTKGRFV
jgi:hypothetical protein